MMRTGGRGYLMRSMTATLCSLKKVEFIEKNFSVRFKQCHIAVFDPNTELCELGKCSMGNHRDHLGVHRALIHRGSQSSYLEWNRPNGESVRVEYNGPSYQIVGGIHSNFYDFGNISHHSVNCDPNSCRELIVLSFLLHPTMD